MAKKNKKSAAAKKAKEEHDAAVENIITHFATTYISADSDRLSSFQDLCEDLDVPVGDSLTQCRKVISTHEQKLHHKF